MAYPTVESTKKTDTLKWSSQAAGKRSSAARYASLLVATLSLTISCAPQKSHKKDNFTRISAGGQYRKGSPSQPQPQTARDAQPTQTPSSPQPQPSASQQDPHQIPTQPQSLCRVTDDPKLDNAYRAQPYCKGLSVQLDANSEIEIRNQLHSLAGDLAGYVFTKENTEVKEDQKVINTYKSIVVLDDSSNPDATTENINLNIPLEFTLPYTPEQIDNSDPTLALEVKLNNVVIPKEKYELSQGAQAHQIIRIKDISLFQGVQGDFQLTVDYTLKTPAK